MTDAGQHRKRTSSEAELIGKKLGPYQILQRIGQGGMAEVYLAVHERLHRQVAIKVLRHELATSTNLQRFLQEARASAALVHPNIVQVYDIGQHDELNYIAQEYVAGVNLKEHLQKTPRHRLGLRETLSILLQVTAALQQSSLTGIVHRDIKPENILLTPKGEAKVADFGLARAAHFDTGELTKVNMTLGTPLYMSPEQIRGEEVDSRSDLYSLGVTLYHILSGRTPFVGDTPLSLAVQHLQTAPPSLLELRPDLPKPMVELVMRLMAKDAKDRPSSPTALLTELEELRKQLQPEVWPTTLIPLPTVQPHLQVNSSVHMATVALSRISNSRSRWLPVLGIACATFLAGTIGYYGFLRANPSPLPTQVSPPLVQRQDSVQNQYLFALYNNTELHWRAVTDYFPPSANELNRVYGAKANLQLAKWYRDHSLDDKAVTILKRLKGQQVPVFCHIMASIELASIYRQKGDEKNSDIELSEALQLSSQLDPSQKNEINRRLPENLNGLWQTT